MCVKMSSIDDIVEKMKYASQRFVLESDYLHVPVESLSRSFRVSQRFVEKRIVAIQKLTSKARHAKTIQQIKERVEKLKRNLDRFEKEEKKYIQQIEDRVRSLKEDNQDPISRFVCDFLARTGKFDISKKIASDLGLESLVDIDLWQEFHTIRTSILSGECKYALNWCDVNASKLRRVQSDFPFRLHVMKFLELARYGDLEKAINYARKNVSPYVTNDSQHYEQRLKLSRRAMSCLIFFEDSLRDEKNFGTYSDLLSESRWKQLSEMFEEEFRRVYTCTKYSSLRRSLEAGLAAMRTPTCSEGRHQECPGCDEDLGGVSSVMPHFRSAHTRIVCPASGKIMNEENPPMALPSGHVYSLEAIKAMTNKDGFVMCPITNSLVHIGEVF